MRFTGCLTAILVTALSTGSALADHMTTYTGCPLIGACNSPGKFITAFGTWDVDANEGCRDPDVPGMYQLCVDWGNNRGHFFFDNQAKRCLRQVSSTAYGCGGGTCWCGEWDEVGCSWRVAGKEEEKVDGAGGDGV
ncbi:hypothetical protein BKA70DRAFT_1131620 [Coprinopsis sp. MPI-PUGE-AT-0042]|nr:hypothetical protein BKA70DRAFT_1131620 [Coprinopsis sp. MPI-PUGE-AT-0042]